MIANTPTGRRSSLLIHKSIVQAGRVGLYVTGSILCTLLTVVLVSSAPVFSQQSSLPSLDQQQIIQFLNRTIGWYEDSAVVQQAATTPGDMIYAVDGRADQILRLSFEFAHAAAQFAANPASGANSASPVDSHRQGLAQAAAKVEDQYNRNRSEIDALRQRLQSASPRERKALESQIAEVESESALLQARRDAIQSVLQFMGGTTEPGLASQIEALERSVPAAMAPDAPGSASLATNKASALAAVAARRTEPTGIWGNLREIFGLSTKLGVIGDHLRHTDELTRSVRDMQSPLRDRLRELASQGDSIVNQPDSQDPAVLAQQKSTLDALTGQFKLVAAAALPLSKEAILLDAYKRNLNNWRATVKSQYSANIKSLLIRLLGLGVLLGIVLGVFEVWRRATFRYIQDARLRRQFLLLRRIALWLVISLVVALALGSELGSLATFAGLLTAGVAVALQNVILAVVGYFLLIGKYGLKVGDRVQVSGVAGEVVEIGLMRLHVMEFAGIGADAQPTGRVVAFSNSVVFQPTAGLFKQVPGTNIIWHELSFTLAADSDYRSVEQRLRTAVDAVFKGYHQDLERQRRLMETSLDSVSIGPLTPSFRFRLIAAGLQVSIRFPVEAGHAAEIDDHVTRGILSAISMEPKLKVVEAEIPTIRLSTDTATKQPV